MDTLLPNVGLGKGTPSPPISLSLLRRFLATLFLDLAREGVLRPIHKTTHDPPIYYLLFADDIE